MFKSSLCGTAAAISAWLCLPLINELRANLASANVILDNIDIKEHWMRQSPRGMQLDIDVK